MQLPGLFALIRSSREHSPTHRLQPNRRTTVREIRLPSDDPHDVGQVLDDMGIAVRTGHHCAWPLMQELKLNATTRASFYLYNTPEEVDVFLDGINQVKKFFKV